MFNQRNHILAGMIFLSSIGLSAQDSISVNYKKYPDYKKVPVGEYYHPAKSKTARTSAVEVLPRRVDNSEKTYFPSVFNQDQGSCGSASRIGYMFTEEINAYRGTDASLSENMYPTQFTWLLTNHGPGKEGMAQDNGIPNMAVYGGRTFSKLFGDQTNEDPFGWMTGYEKWYGAMFNRISGTSNIGPINQKVYADMLKGWLWNHNGDANFQGRGGIAGIGVASAATLGTIGTGKYVGQQFIKYWGTQVDHALTIIGYDDDIWCDINGDAVQTADELGAWIIVNSWGDGWANKGMVYCPYSQSKPTKTSTDFWQPELYHVRVNYRPLKALKVKMDFSHRSELSLSVGVSTNLNATTPDRQIPLSHFTYCGWQLKNGVTVHDVPMLGQWADGIMHTEAMEFGYDLTDLVASFDQSKPLKYFFIVNSSAAATGRGTIVECAIMDYALDPKGIEIPFLQKNVTILKPAKQTVISTSLQGEPLNAPLNLIWKSETEISWSKPQYSPYSISAYKLYKNNTLLATITGADVTNYVVADSQAGDSYALTAVYEANNVQVESGKSNQLTKLAPSTSTAVLETGSMAFSNSGFTIPAVFANGMKQCTMEFWIKPTVVKDWNFQIGQGWGTFLFHFNNGGGMSVGYTSGNRLHNVSPVKVNEWTHLAVVLDGPKITLYKNGLAVGTTTDNGNGMPVFPNFAVGISGSGIDGKMDEFRIWNKALTQNEIQAGKDQLILHPETLPSLVAYYQMDKVTTKLKDSKGSNDATLVGTGTVNATDYPLLQTTNDFTLSAPSCYVGQVVEINTSVNPANTVSVVWNAPEAGLSNVTTLKPSFRFNTTGTFEITKTVTTSTAQTIVATKTIEVMALSLPEPQFLVNKLTVGTGERISFENRTATPLNAYRWTMTGAETETASTVNAAAQYAVAGEYTVTLTAINSTGQKSLSKTIVVETSAPVAVFEAAQNYTIKGGSVKFSDKSLYAPQRYKWEFEKGSPQQSTEQNPSVVYNHPGRFKVKLTVYNEKGESTVEKTKYVVVSNENPGNSLSFDGVNDYLKIDNLFGEGTTNTNFTIEWWMKAKTNKDNCQIMGTDGFSIKENAKGGLSIGFGDTDRMSVPDATIEAGSWDHFAFTFKNGVGYFYKNGSIVGYKSFTTKTVASSVWAAGLKVGDLTNSAEVAIDELRIWNTTRTQDELLCNADNKLVNPQSLVNLEAYFTFDESASTTPQDYSSHNRVTLRQNIGPVGDMWSASSIFCLPLYAPVAFEPDAKSTYIIYNAANGMRFNTSASTYYAEYKTEFKETGSLVGPCGVGTTHGIHNKYVSTANSEFSITKNSSNLWTLKDVNTNYYVRKDMGYMVTSATDSRATLNGFFKDSFGVVRVAYSTGLYMTVNGNDWFAGGGVTDFSFLFEEVKPVAASAPFAEMSADPLQQLRFTALGQLTGQPKALQGSVSYAMTVENNKWVPLHFVAPLEEITFQGKVVNVDTVRLGGKLVLARDFEIRKYENGQLIAINSMAAPLPAGSYLVRLKNPLLVGTKIIFRTAKNVQFQDVPAQPKVNSLCGSDMARNTAIDNITAYYKVNSAGDKLVLTKGSLANLAPFEAYVPYFGNADAAPAQIDLNGNVAGVGSLQGDADRVIVLVENGYVKLKGTDSLFKIYAISGVQIPADQQLAKGCYVVLVNGRAYKIIVR